MHWRIPIVGVLALLVAVSCQQQPVEPQQEVLVTAPAFDFSNGPAEPGNSYIVRDEWGGFAWFFIDPVTELGALVTDDACSIFEEATLIPFQEIFNPALEGASRMYHEAGWINAAILEEPYGCDDVLATGLVHNKWRDNDIFPWLTDNPRANSFGGGLNGRVGDYSVSYRFHIVWNPEHLDWDGVFTEKIMIK
jgi:hypothetical protein